MDIKNITKWTAAEIKDRMDDLKLRPYHLMSLCDMTDAEVESCLNGNELPGLYSLVLLAEHLECTVNDLLGFEEVDVVEVYEVYCASCMFFKKTQYAACLSDRIIRYLAEHDMNITEMAIKTDIKQDTLRHWFSKTHPRLPSTPKFLQICDALGCTPTELLGY